MDWSRERYRQSVNDLAPFLSELVSTIGRRERRLAAVRYVEGLLLPAQGKYVRPLANWLGVDEQSLQQCLTDSPWNHEDLWRAIRRSHASRITPIDVWLLREQIWPKQGKHSVGVAQQRRSARHRKAACQVSLEVLIGHGPLVSPVAGRLCLPDEWCDASRRRRAGVPPDIEPESRSSLAVHLLQRLLRDGVGQAPLVASCAFADDGGFRDELRALGLEFVIECEPAAYTIRPLAGTVDARDGQADTSGPPISMRRFLERTPKSAGAICHTITPPGRTTRTTYRWQRVLVVAEEREPEPLWLVVEWPAGDFNCRDAYLAHLKEPPTEEIAVKVSRAAQYVEDYERCFERILDLSSYQGRSWNGFHHHLALAAVACTFITHTELLRAGVKPAPDTIPDPLIVDETSRLSTLI